MILIKKHSVLRILEDDACIRYLQGRLEEIAQTVLLKLQRKVAKNTENKYVSYNRHKIDTKICGYYCVPKPDKLIIYQKITNRGYLYTSNATQKIVSFYLVRPKKNKFICRELKQDWTDKCSFKQAYWQEIHEFFNNLRSEEALEVNEFV